MLYNGLKISKTGLYPSVYMPEHPRAIESNGSVYIHILVAEEKLGRPLEKDECVHHVNENKNDFSVSNLWVFKTQSDHTAYHIALKNNWDYILICKNNVFECVTPAHNNYRSKYEFIAYKNNNQIHNDICINNTGKISCCEKCGKLINKSAKYCVDCFKKIQSEKIPNKETLSDLLSKYNYSEIGRMYGVTSNAVKKWAKKYYLYVNQFYKIPDKDVLQSLLQKHSRRHVAVLYNVTPEVVRNWEIKLNIQVPKLLSVQCLETSEIFENKKIASMSKYPNLQPKYAALKIATACKTGQDFRGYHWKALRC